jgi:transporter family-2 protein
VIAALSTGVLIGLQATLSRYLGSTIGDLRTCLFTNFIGGSIAGLVVVGLLVKGGWSIRDVSISGYGILALSGTLGILIKTGTAFSLQRTGVAAGVGTLILGQLLISVLVDSYGFGGAEPIPLSFSRIVGLILLAIGVYFVLPKQF